MSSTTTFSSSVEDELTTTPAIGDAFAGVLGAYRDEGFQAGYGRAVNDLLAEFLRRRPGASPALRAALRAFQDHLEASAGVSVTDHFVHDGLGI
jgi:hypothetical protein